jgi:hypothetical protein
MRKIKFRVWDKYRNEYLSGGNVFIGIKPVVKLRLGEFMNHIAPNRRKL